VGSIFVSEVIESQTGEFAHENKLLTKQLIATRLATGLI